MHPIIKVENLGKRYQIGLRQPYRTLRESVIETVAAPVRGIAALLSRNGDEKRDRQNPHVWALRDLSFEVAPGEVLGIIGRNGSGKSTLLKILSRITEPTTGRVELYGRVGSLLEVGTGFHPELTGRENIYLSGAILGMRRAEIARKFDEMVAFAEIEQFVDTPVKRYSSGMYVRLAFAVAAHLESQIILVDEVLAVGDAAFQKRCLAKIGEVVREGRTVLFVSHNMASIEALCESCLLIRQGRLEDKGEPGKIIERYMAAEAGQGSGERSLIDHPGRRRDSIPMMTSVALFSDSRQPISGLRMGSPLSVRVSFSSPEPLRPIIGVNIRTAQGAPVFGVSNRWTHQGFDGPVLRSATISCDFKSLPLMPGTYIVDLGFGDFGDISRELDVVFEAIAFEVFPTDVYGTGRLPRHTDGPVFWDANWIVSTRDAVD